MIGDGYHVVHPPQGEEVVVKVKPFKEGSFWMDFILSVQKSPEVLFFIAYPQAIQQVRQVLEYLGLVSKGAEAINTVLDVIKFLKNGHPEKIEQSGPNEIQYVNHDGETMTVNVQVHKLINNGTIQNNYYFALGKPLEHEGVTSIETLIPEDP